MPRTVLSVGQCVPDASSLNRFLKANFDVQIDTADTAPEALDLLRKGPFDLVLINRKLDADYTDGTEILRQIKADAAMSATPVMIVSNYPEYQDAAVKLGAQYGFGKAELGSTDVITRLQPFLGTRS
ncbi:MAG TPA: response regulator [Planctomycetaceae bacterium]|nr:response regulator [Planctomycetaceae bacterium]